MTQATGSADARHDQRSKDSADDYSTSAINQAPTRQLGDKVFITVPGPAGAGALSLKRRRKNNDD